ncbi:LLM class F420-dependent oxidoreductase [Nocardia sp. NPDC004711]
MRHGVVLFTSDRGIRPAALAKAAEERGFDSFYVPEHTHIPVKRDAPHPGTGDASLPDDRYMRTLDPWIALATVAEVTERIELSTAVALPVQHDPIALAKTLATLDHLSGGRVSLCAGFGWNADELANHRVPFTRRRAVLREYVEAMRVLWTEEEASYAGEFISFEPAWAWPKPERHIPLIIGAEAGPKTLAWIADHADGWLSTPRTDDVFARAKEFAQVWSEHGRDGAPIIKALGPDPDLHDKYVDAGVTDLVWSAGDGTETQALRRLDEIAGRFDL